MRRDFHRCRVAKGAWQLNFQTQLRQKPRTRPLAHVKNIAKTVRAAIVRIRHIARALGIQVAQQPHFGPRFRTWRQSQHVAQIIAIHHQNVIELGEITGLKVAGAGRQRHTPGLTGRTRARIGQFAHVPIARTGAVDEKVLRQPGFFHQMRENAFRLRGATDIAQTHKAHANHPTLLRRRRVRQRQPAVNASNLTDRRRHAKLAGLPIGVRVAQVRLLILLLLLLPGPVLAKGQAQKPQPAQVDRALLRRCADAKHRDTRECVLLRKAAADHVKKGEAPRKNSAGSEHQAVASPAHPQRGGDPKAGNSQSPKNSKADEEKPKALSAKEKKQLAALKTTCADKKKAKTTQCKKFFADEKERAEAAERQKLRKVCADKKQAKTAQCKKFLAAEKKSRGQTVSVCGRKYGIAKKNEKVANFAKRYRLAEPTLRAWNNLGKVAKLKGGSRYLVQKSPHDGVVLKGGVLLEGDDEHFAIQRPLRGWGKPLLVEVLRVAIHAAQRQNPLGTHLILGDLSKEGGGCLPPHKSHRGGVDADVGLYMRGAHQRKWLAGATPETLDADRTWLLLRAFLSTGKLQFAFIDYSLQQPLYEAGLRAGEPEEHLKAWFQWPRPIEQAHDTVIRHLAGHDNHMHVRFICDSEENCVLPEEAKLRLEHARIEMLGSVDDIQRRQHPMQTPAVPMAMR